MREFKTPKSALKFCKENNIPYSLIEKINKTITIKRKWQNIVIREYPKEIVVYKIKEVA